MQVVNKKQSWKVWATTEYDVLMWVAMHASSHEEGDLANSSINFYLFYVIEFDLI